MRVLVIKLAWGYVVNLIPVSLELLGISAAPACWGLLPACVYIHVVKVLYTLY